MNLENRKLALKFAIDAGISEPSSQKLQKFLELCAEHFIHIGSEVMRERVMRARGNGQLYPVEIRALPGITLEDLKCK